MKSVVLIVTIFMSDGSVVTSPAFPAESKAECVVRGDKISEYYSKHNDISRLKYSCYEVKPEIDEVVDEADCKKEKK